MAGIEIRCGRLRDGQTNYGSADYGDRKPVTLPVFFRNSYFRIIKGRVVQNSLPLEIGDKGTVLEPGKVIYEAPVSGANGVVIEIKVV